MPHLILEYSSNLPDFDVSVTLAAINRALAKTGHFQLSAIKSRAYCVTDYVVADGSGGTKTAIGFAALRLHTRLEDSSAKADVSTLLLSLMKDHIAPLPVGETQYTVDIMKIDEQCYAKDVVTRR